jgi:hypothetical protein
MKTKKKCSTTSVKDTVEYKKIEKKLLSFYNPNGSFEFDKCVKWILRLVYETHP